MQKHAVSLGTPVSWHWLSGWQATQWETVRSHTGFRQWRPAANTNMTIAWETCGICHNKKRPSRGSTHKPPKSSNFRQCQAKLMQQLTPPEAGKRRHYRDWFPHILRNNMSVPDQPFFTDETRFHLNECRLAPRKSVFGTPYRIGELWDSCLLIHCRWCCVQRSRARVYGFVRTGWTRLLVSARPCDLPQC
jgi:hypothetical protein